LRLILEELMLDLMFQLPSTSGITECVITREVVLNKVNPLTLLEKAG
jgi:ATP-dependent Clp protease ATP-binding subunit ClpX